ncbi:hypothetical protein N665_0164s0040 [Sinapis alba]|nr:hypothetical protein N665_0164s0040 [Sinapis alba]
MISVAQGVVPVLVRLLDSCNMSMKEKIVAVISIISIVESSKHVLITEGLSLLNHLLRVLESGSGFANEKACVALQALSLSKENARAIGCRGGISSLLEISQAGTPGSQAFAARVLRNLALFTETKENFVEENAVFVLVSLGSSGVVLLNNLALCPILLKLFLLLGFSSKSRKEIGESGCMGALIDMLDGKAMEEKEAASKALSTLLVCTRNIKIFKKSDKGILNLCKAIRDCGYVINLYVRNTDESCCVTFLYMLFDD